MALKMTCPVCKNRMTINLQDGIVYCAYCGYQPIHEWRRLAPEAPRLKLHPLIIKQAAQTEVEVIECPHCGGDDLQPIANQNVIRCPHCNSIYPIQEHYEATPKTLRGVLMKRQGHAVIRKITQRILDCPSCSAQVTLNNENLTQVCPFCESKQVIASDSHHSFDVPDGLVPFKIGQQQAQELVENKLNSGLFGWTRIFRDKITRISGNPLYLPWWVFDITVDVYWRYDKVAYNKGIETHHIQVKPLYAALANRDEMSKLLPYDLADLREYKPDMLAQIQAEVPQVEPYEAAPLIIKQAIQKAERRTRAKRPIYNTTTVNDYQTVRSRLQMASHIKQVDYRLVLLPVWVVLLYETDGDTRRVFINGQTGEVVLEGNTIWRIFQE